MALSPSFTAALRAIFQPWTASAQAPAAASRFATSQQAAKEVRISAAVFPYLPDNPSRYTQLLLFENYSRGRAIIW